MYNYQLPPTQDADYMVVLDASHADAFLQASRTAVRVLTFMAHPQGALGVMKTRNVFLTGPMEFSNNTIFDAKSVENFGSHYILPEQRVIINNFRNQLNGHVRVAMNNTMAALKSTTLHLVFFMGGPLFIVSPQEISNPYRIALIRFEGAKEMSVERTCVIANKASKIAYETMWAMLSEKIAQQKSEQSTDDNAPKDVLDQPAAHSSPPAYSSEEDELDGIDQDASESAGTTDSEPTNGNAPQPADFNIDDTQDLSF